VFGTRRISPTRTHPDHGKGASTAATATCLEGPGPAIRQVALCAGSRCEFCLFHKQDSYQPYQLDHIISRKHPGLSLRENLAYSCILRHSLQACACIG
jgi:hypothetical protein